MEIFRGSGKGASAQGRINGEFADDSCSTASEKALEGFRKLAGQPIHYNPKMRAEIDPLFLKP